VRYDLSIDDSIQDTALLGRRLLDEARDGVLYCAEIGAYSRAEQKGLAFLLSKLERHNTLIVCSSSEQLGNLAADADRCTRWSLALAGYAIEQRAGNRDVLQRWIVRWTPRAEAAAAGLGQLFEQLPSGGRSADTVGNAANLARRGVLNQAGLAG